MLDRQNLVALMKAAAKANPSDPVAYSYGDKKLGYEALNETLREELNAYAGTYAMYSRAVVLALLFAAAGHRHHTDDHAQAQQNTKKFPFHNYRSFIFIGLSTVKGISL